MSHTGQSFHKLTGKVIFHDGQKFFSSQVTFIDGLLMIIILREFLFLVFKNSDFVLSRNDISQ